MTDLMTADIENTIAEFLKLLPLFIPVLIIEYGLMIFALVHAIRNEVSYIPKWGWILIIVLINIIGPIIFLLVGRKKETEND
ncbi:MAG: PLDc N-terminal domain-containing protein [Actinomycetota bacterium]|nr:PLDc N-terminal domain-containing protein [Actinomycetota bacterium]